jgi:hypothetical protein
VGCSHGACWDVCERRLSLATTGSVVVMPGVPPHVCMYSCSTHPFETIVLLFSFETKHGALVRLSTVPKSLAESISKTVSKRNFYVIL